MGLFGVFRGIFLRFLGVLFSFLCLGFVYGRSGLGGYRTVSVIVGFV